MASILSPPRTGPKPKTHVSKGTLPPIIDPTQPPTKTSPWQQINSTPFIFSITVTLPSSFHDLLWPQLTTTSPTIPQLRYAKVLLTLTDILSDPFFTRYIKTGNILLLSEGIPGISDWVCRLCDGKLRIEMAREVYERCGLQGRPERGNGGARKHGRDRWVVELNLRETAMVRGRKGFERLLRAAREVLVEGRVWLFRDLGVGGGKRGEGKDGDEEVIVKFHPTIIDVEPEVLEIRDVLVPTVISRDGGDVKSISLDAHDDYYEVIEWLDLVGLASPRVTKSNTADPYICQYSVPDADTATVENLRTVTWNGLLDRNWCTQLLISIIRCSRKLKASHWLALTVKSHHTDALGRRDGCTVILRPNEPGNTSGTQDVVMEDVSAQTADEAKEVDGSSSDGLQRFVCFEFIDTITT